MNSSLKSLHMILTILSKIKIFIRFALQNNLISSGFDSNYSNI
jgi:hypothetical protein